MDEQELELRTVIFRLPDSKVADLVIHLSSFIADNNITVEFTDGHGTESSLQVVNGARESSYNPERIAWLPINEGEKPTFVITKAHLRAYSKEATGDTTIGERVANALWRHHQIVGHLPAVACNDDGQFVGVRADRFSHLLTQLKHKTQKVNGIGASGLELLERYNQELFTKATETHEEAGRDQGPTSPMQ